MTTNIHEANPFDDFVPSEISDAQFLSNLNEGRQREKLRDAYENERDTIHDEPILASPEQLKQAWDKLLQTSSYVERDLRDVPMLQKTSDEYIEIENAIHEGEFEIKTTIGNHRAALYARFRDK